MTSLKIATVSVAFYIASSCAVQSQTITETRANCIKHVTGRDPYTSAGYLRWIPDHFQSAIHDCVQKAEAKPKPAPPQAVEQKNPPTKSPTQANTTNRDNKASPIASKELPSPKQMNDPPKAASKTPDSIYVDDVQTFFTGGGSVDVVTFVPLLQNAKQEVENGKNGSGPAVSSLREHLNTNQAFKIFYDQLISRRADEAKQEKEILLATVKNAERPITDYIRGNLNDPNLNQYLDAIKMIGAANSDTSSDSLKIIISKLSSLNPAYTQPQSPNNNASEQKALAPIQNISPINATSSNNDFNSIFPSGIYAKTEKDCARYLANPKQMRMNERFERVTIKGREISRYYTGGCTVRNMTGTGPSFVISADCTEEGDTSKEKYTFSVRDGKFNFGQFDEGGTSWWHLCKPVNISEDDGSKFIGREISVGSRCGSGSSIKMISGVNTSRAQLTAETTIEIARDACLCEEPDLKGQKLEICARDILKRSSTDTASANCDQVVVTDTSGRTRKFTGRIRNDNPELIEIKTGKTVDVASYSGFYVSLEQLSVLCPAKVCQRKHSSTETLLGCKTF